MFLKLDGISGESLDQKHPNEIDVLSFSWGVANSGDAAPRKRGKPHATALTVTVYTSKASPSLFLHCCTGQHIKTGVITARKAGERPMEFLHIKLTDILVSSYSTGSGGGDTLPTENIGLEFAKVQFIYTPQTASGAPGADVSAAFNFLTDKKF
jgi:type VI secretion system secreted protein Hcp